MFFKSRKIIKEPALVSGAALLFFAFLVTQAPLWAQRDYMEPIPVSPAELANAYQSNFHQADAMYTGKLLLVTGRIKTIRPAQRTYNYHHDKIYAYITMDTGRNRPLVVYFWDWEAANMGARRVGNTITVMGFCQGVTPQLSLINACLYPGGCGGPVPGFYGPHYELPPSPLPQPRPRR